jgi:hypothetical protein
MIGDIASDHCARANHRLFAYGHPGKNYGSASNGSSPFDARSHNQPIIFSLQSPFHGRARIQIIGEHNAVPDENVVFDGHAFANKRVRRNLATLPDNRILLDLNKRSNFGVIADCTAVEIYQIRLEYLHTVAQDYIGGNWHEEKLRSSQKAEGTIHQNEWRINLPRAVFLAKWADFLISDFTIRIGVAPSLVLD